MNEWGKLKLLALSGVLTTLGIIKITIYSIYYLKLVYL